jgi:hypothetical protein
MKSDRLWVMLTTILICTMVVWGFDTDGRYLQQIGLWISGLMAGALITDGRDQQ